ncbi:serine hydrolase domain-containing protein [Hyphococcus luteus]|uniref:Serine hydrolase n=1 Tax=Hyphococcus luteus TaxID=2058213 RepID=A0A2S7K6D3_9PROT|nr:serine hydrolase domain-containing protein [Marinicaulis flavus]PQA88018.1 serine hydrolase [Marinicaulis flavus]
MRRVLLSIFLGIVAGAVALGLAVGDALYGWTRAPLAPRGDWAGFFSAAAERIDEKANGNAAFVLIDGGEIRGMHFFSVGEAVNQDSQFQVASLSKWITAVGVMTLVERGAVDLDAPVSTYLTRWSLPESDYDNDGVTVRRLLSHMAGLTDGLGYGGFAPGEPVQSLEDSLTKASDASPGASGVVKVGAEPGEAWAYSGGGYALLQLIIEEVSGRSFEDYMQEAVLAPLGMNDSTFVYDETYPHVAEIYDVDGTFATRYAFSAPSAAGFYTTVHDMARFLLAHFEGSDGAPAGRGVLTPETLAMMRAPEAYLYGAPSWGLGVILYAPDGSGDFVAGHDGNNDPAINTAARFNPSSKDGVVLLESGNALLASEIAGEWVFWDTGKVGNLTVAIEATETLQKAALAGAAGLLAGFAGGMVLFRRRQA